MKRSFEVWRRRLRLWAIPFAFCLVNLLAVLIYRTALAGNVEGLQNLVQKAARESARLDQERRDREAFLERVEQRRADVKVLYDEHFSTRAKRLTDMTREAKRLARQAGLVPRSLAYPETEIVEGELRQRRIIFPIQGTYDQLRTFINFLELTDQFLTLERVSLAGSSSDGGNLGLSIQLELSTIFADAEGRSASAGGAP